MILALNVRGRGALNLIVCCVMVEAPEMMRRFQINCHTAARVRPPIHAVMAPEPAVLRRQRGADQRLGDFRKGRELLEGTVAVTGQAQGCAVPVQQLNGRRRRREQGRRQGARRKPESA